MTLDRIRDYLRDLERGAILERIDGVGLAVGVPVGYRLVRDLGVEAPRVDAAGALATGETAQQRIWTALRVAGVGTAAELAAMASDPARAVSEDTVREYLYRLHSAGRVHYRSPGQGARAQKGVYMLPRGLNTGPKAPSVDRRGKQVKDKNTGACYPFGAQGAGHE